MQGRCNQALVDFHKKTLLYHIIRGEIEEKYALEACNAVFGKTDASGRRRSSRATRKPYKYQDEAPASQLTPLAAATHPSAGPIHKQPNNRLTSAAKLVKRSLETLGAKGKVVRAPKRKLASPKPTIVLKKAKRDANSSGSKRKHQSHQSSKHHQKHHHRSRRSSSSSSSSQSTSSSSSSCSTCASSRSSSPEIVAVEAPRKLHQPKKPSAHPALKRLAKARSPHPKPAASLKPASLILPPSNVMVADARNSPKLLPPEQAAALAKERASSSSNGSVFASSVASSFKTLYKPTFNLPSGALSKSGHLYQQFGSISIPTSSRRSERAATKPDFVRLAESMKADELEQRISEALPAAPPAPPATATPNRPPKPKTPRAKAKAATNNGNSNGNGTLVTGAVGPSTSGKEHIAPMPKTKSNLTGAKGTKKGLSSSEDSFDSQTSLSESESASDTEGGGAQRRSRKQHRSRRSHAGQVAASIVPGSRYFEFNPYANARFRSSRFKPRDRTLDSKRDSMDECDSDDAADMANALARPMSHDEKRQLSTMISRLPGARPKRVHSLALYFRVYTYALVQCELLCAENGLLGVIHIIRTCEPSMRDKFKQENEAEIDFEVLQARTLRELEAFARNALYNVRVPKSFPVAASLAQQPKRNSLSGTLHETLADAPLVCWFVCLVITTTSTHSCSDTTAALAI